MIRTRLPFQYTLFLDAYSLIETAKRNNLDPEKYIEYLLDKLPNEENLTDQEHLSAYLPWTKEVQEKCKTRIEQRKAA